MLPLVYIESSVISYLTSRPSSYPIKSAWQKVTQQWWASGLSRVTGCLSPFVVEEISAGDPQAAEERINMVRELVMLDTMLKLRLWLITSCLAVVCRKKHGLMLCTLLARPTMMSILC